LSNGEWDTLEERRLIDLMLTIKIWDSKALSGENRLA